MEGLWKCVESVENREQSVEFCLNLCLKSVRLLLDRQLEQVVDCSEKQ